MNKLYYSETAAFFFYLFIYFFLDTPFLVLCGFFVSHNCHDKHSLSAQSVLAACRLVNGPQWRRSMWFKEGQRIYLICIFSKSLQIFFFIFLKNLGITLNVCYARRVPGDAVWVSNLLEGWTLTKQTRRARH